MVGGVGAPCVVDGERASGCDGGECRSRLFEAIRDLGGSVVAVEAI